MAVPTRLITQFADIDLKDRDTGRVERKETSLRKSRLERRNGLRFGELLQLFSRGRERIVAL